MSQIGSFGHVEHLDLDRLFGENGARFHAGSAQIIVTIAIADYALIGQGVQIGKIGNGVGLNKAIDGFALM